MKTNEPARALHIGANVYSITLAAETPAAELRGHYIRSGESGAYVWHDGPAIVAWRTGGRLALNELDKASDDALTLLYAILDDAALARLTLPTDETVRPSAGFSCVATMNGEPASLPEALADRFAVRILIDEPHPSAIASLPERMRLAAKQTCSLEDAERRISLRTWLAFAEIAERAGDERAARLLFRERASVILDSLSIAGAPGGHTEPLSLRVEDSECWSLAELAMECCSRLLLYGPPGTGKTRFASTAGLQTV
jgi:MoxR-like ATPase